MENSLTGAMETGWEEPAQVRRTIMLPRELERRLAEAAHKGGVSANSLVRDLIAQGLARLDDGGGIHD